MKNAAGIQDFRRIAIDSNYAVIVEKLASYELFRDLDSMAEGSF
jgi:hypothetical protein